MIDKPKILLDMCAEGLQAIKAAKEELNATYICPVHGEMGYNNLIIFQRPGKYVKMCTSCLVDHLVSAGVREVEVNHD